MLESETFSIIFPKIWIEKAVDGLLNAEWVSKMDFDE